MQSTLSENKVGHSALRLKPLKVSCLHKNVSMPIHFFLSPMDGTNTCVGDRCVSTRGLPKRQTWVSLERGRWEQYTPYLTIVKGKQL